MSSTSTTKRPVVSFLPTYKFRQDEKDPVIDAVHTAINDAGMKISDLHHKSGVAHSTINNWFDGPTRQPQHSKLAAVLGAAGYEFAIVPAKRRSNGSAIKARAPRILQLHY